MLRVLENCDTTSVILVLLEIIKQNQIKEDDCNISNLAIKCLIKITQNLKDYINNIQLDKILLQMHLILVNYDKYISNLEIKTQTDIMTVKFIKNFIIDIVKIKKQNVLIDYDNSIKKHKIKDNHILNWIKNTLLMLKNIESNKQNPNLSKSSINKSYDDYDNEDNDNFSDNNDIENDNDNDNYNDNEDDKDEDEKEIEDYKDDKVKEESNKDNRDNKDNKDNRVSSDLRNKYKKRNIRVNEDNTNPNIMKKASNKINNNKIAEINNRRNNPGNRSEIDSKTKFKNDYNSIVERIKSLKQNLKDYNINYLNNSIQIKRKSTKSRKPGV